MRGLNLKTENKPGESPLPTRHSHASYAIIKARFSSADRYLMQFNKHWKTFNFISGHYEEDLDQGDFKKTIIREIEEELPTLKHGVDFEVRSILDFPLEEVSFSERFRQWTAYKFMVYQMFFLKPLTTYQYLWQESLTNRWFTLEEIEQGMSNDGEKIAYFPVKLIISEIPGGLESLSYSTKSPKHILVSK